MLKTFIITTQNYCFNHGYSHKREIQEIQQTLPNFFFFAEYSEVQKHNALI